MKLLIRLATILLSVTLIAGLGIDAYLIWLNNSVPPAPAAPSVEIRSVQVGQVVSLAVDVRGKQVTRAELWNENQLLARETNPNPALADPWMVAWQWTPPAPGAYSLAARAFDQAGHYGASTLFEVVVPPRMRLIFSSNRGGKPAANGDAPSYGLYILTPDTRETVPFNPTVNEDRQASVSRTGTVAFAENRSGAWHILTRGLNAAETIDLTPDLASAQRPVWSPDGQRLAFEVTNGSATNIVVSDARGQNRVQVTGGDAYDGQASFSADGRRLVFAGQRGGQWDIYAVDASGQNLARLTGDGPVNWQPSWSPDGSRIAFASNKSGVSQIYVMPADGKAAPTRLTSFPSGAEQPAWSPDGNWIAFAAFTGEGEANDRRELYLMYAPQDQPPAEGRGLIRLTQNGFDDTEPEWIEQ